MPKMRTWTVKQLKDAVKHSHSYRQVLAQLGLKAAGGNYEQLKRYIREYDLNIDHFKGKGWNKGMKGIGVYQYTLEEILVKNSTYQSYKLRNRLIKEGIKKPECEECGWAKRSADGYLPLELDHINGRKEDNRLENLRILCPNCHSLKPTHRGRNRSKDTKKVFVKPGW